MSMCFGTGQNIRWKLFFRPVPKNISEEIIDTYDIFVLLSLILAIVSLILVFLIIRFVRKRQDSELYNEILIQKNNLS